jgi:hypothetical protein
MGVAVLAVPDDAAAGAVPVACGGAAVAARLYEHARMSAVEADDDGSDDDEPVERQTIR